VHLEHVWGHSARALGDRLSELPSPTSRMAGFEAFLRDKLDARSSRFSLDAHPAVGFAIQRFRHLPSAISVAEVARSTGLSQRRFSQLFRERVGLPPKVWCRVQRFQHAVRQLYAGADLRWSDLALDCGFYDQSHFANEFRAFSGIDMTTYNNAGRTLWANHIHEN
jgi:AraC-like DNA-binding protein